MFTEEQRLEIQKKLQRILDNIDDAIEDPNLGPADLLLILGELQSVARLTEVLDVPPDEQRVHH